MSVKDQGPEAGAVDSTTSVPLTSETDTTKTSSSASPNNGETDSDIQAQIERKRLEHEQQRAQQRKAFEQQMAQLEQQQREEEQNLLQQRGAAAASAPTTPPNEASATDSKSAATAANKVVEAGEARSKALSHLYNSMPSSRRQSGEETDLASAVGAMSIGKGGANKSSLSHETTDDATGTPGFNERFLFDDELDNEDSAFVKKYNLKGGDSDFPILVQGGSSRSAGAEADWPKFGGAAASNSSGDANAAAAGDTSSSSLRAASVTGKSPPPQGTPSIAAAAAFGTSAGRQQAAFPLPSPSPRLSQTGRSSPAINAAAAFAGANSRGPASPSPGLGGLCGEVGRSGGGSRFVNTAVPPSSNLKTNQGGAAFPSFNLGAFSGASTGSESPNRFGPYSPNAAEVAARRGSRPNSGFFDAFNPTAGANVTGALFPTDKYSIGMGVGSDGGLGPKPPRGNGKGSDLDSATPLEELQGEIFTLCKDQHGCRYLQKKLEESSPAHRDLIFSETFPHFPDLMTDPFGNYLCQKMLEFCTDEQRNLIVELVAPELVSISLNMHGTRAVQKMIDFLSTPRQIRCIIGALGMNVVTLIKDLNGNHVVQKCLNRLGAEDNQFIYNAVAAHCVEVATHRHGCCVLQRCIDHASEGQRVQLVAEITYNALSLVQDPFGNYVVQYVLDLSIPRFTDAVVRQFVGNVCQLSVQKFSSNVIEKCIRVSEPGVRKELIEELLNRARLEKLLRDSFANYVVQTSLDYADPVQRMRLVECIRPILPVIRNTPYGKRIQSKLLRDNLDLGPQNGGPYGYPQHQYGGQQYGMGGGYQRPPGGGGYMGYGGHQGQMVGQYPYQQHQMYGGAPAQRIPSAQGGGGLNLPPPNFQSPSYGGGVGFNVNLPPPSAMLGRGGQPSFSNSPAPSNGGNGGGGFNY